ncbi:bacteriocin secretion accessory protein [Streptococcus suis]|nr:bacteriocin secretion accessory protein [Streptococcus suis]NQO88479.1 bacteriocin secretion accessory protein [Streptococcus suis]HEM5453072.1 bacteriocin secretion accessory protein [Streptococcus suis]HEM5496626.1 bacteriocin secretion accessory protein [Streptococcus suis]
MNPNLFKSAEFYRRRYHNFATLLIVPLTLLLLFLIVFSLFATKEVTVIAQGEITPTSIIASIQSTSNNTIIANYMTNNQEVKKGEVLVHYLETMEDSQKKALEMQLATLNRQLAELEILESSLKQGTNLFSETDEFGYSNTFHQFISQSQEIELNVAKSNTEVSNQAALADNTIAAIDEQINQTYQEIREYEELRQAMINRSSSLPSTNPQQATLNTYLQQTQQEQNESTLQQYLTQIDQNISRLEASISNLQIQRAGTGSISTYDNSMATRIETLRSQFLQTAAQQKVTIEQQITELSAQIEQVSVQSDNNTIKAPETGILHLNPEFEGKNLIPSGSEMAQIFPNIHESKEILITYYVASEYVSLLKKKQTVRLNLEKVGNQPITIVGKINTIAQTGTKTEQGNLFKIAALATLSVKESSLIQYGLQGRVTSVIAKKTYFDYYKDKLLNLSDEPFRTLQ